jgi:hypothetical protein
MRKREFLSKKGETRPLKAKAFFGTHAGTETVHRTVSILRIAFFEPLFFTSKKEVSKMTLPFLAQKERLELSRRLPDLRP